MAGGGEEGVGGGREESVAAKRSHHDNGERFIKLSHSNFYLYLWVMIYPVGRKEKSPLKR